MVSLKPAESKISPVIKCESVYKIFGLNAKKMLKNAQGKVDAEVFQKEGCVVGVNNACLLYTSPSPRDGLLSRMPSSA